MGRCTRPRVGRRLPDGRVIPGGEDQGEALFQLPCGQCMDCRLDQADQWQTRCENEQSMSDHNCWLTLTYSEEALQERLTKHGTHPAALSKKDWQWFAKRLRHRHSFQYMAVGEYGGQFGRPHFHALIFGEDFHQDRVYIGLINGYPTWRSASLEKAWPYGHATIGKMEPQTISYVCRYILKKRRGPTKHEPIEHIDATTGEVTEIPPEFLLMSRNPAIGQRWYKQFRRDAFPSDYLYRKGAKIRPPNYYLGLLRKENEAQWRAVKEKRKEYAEKKERRDTRQNRARRERATARTLQRKAKP